MALVVGLPLILRGVANDVSILLIGLVLILAVAGIAILVSVLQDRGENKREEHVVHFLKQTLEAK